MAGMDQHEQAIAAHETMTNGSADAHPRKNGGKSSEDDGKSDRFYRAVGSH